jgi:hypothetical protein
MATSSDINHLNNEAIAKTLKNVGKILANAVPALA